MTSVSHRYETFLKPDEARFVRLCERGKLYETFMDRLRMPVRGKVKEQFFAVVYGSNEVRSPLKSVFAGDFPNVAEVVRSHKKRDYAFLPRLMQNIESNFIVNTVCRRLMTEWPEAPVLTIHDCILTTPQHADAFQRVVREEFHRLGLEPSLHVRQLGQPAAESVQDRASAH